MPVAAAPPQLLAPQAKGKKPEFAFVYARAAGDASGAAKVLYNAKASDTSVHQPLWTKCGGNYCGVGRDPFRKI
jgi:hypothetical protein